MYNDFIIVGPKSDPAKIAGSKDAAAALRAISERKLPFASRGDNSGTNIAELQLWKEAGVDLAAVRGPWYREMGQGMGAVLNAAGAMGAYTLTDRGTWISFKNKGDLQIAVEGDKRLFNQYGVMLVNPAKFPQVKVADGQAFVDWLVSPDGQQTLAGYKIEGKQLFFPNANDPGRDSGIRWPRRFRGRNLVCARATPKAARGLTGRPRAKQGGIPWVAISEPQHEAFWSKPNWEDLKRTFASNPPNGVTHVI